MYLYTFNLIQAMISCYHNKIKTISHSIILLLPSETDWRWPHDLLPSVSQMFSFPIETMFANRWKNDRKKFIREQSRMRLHVILFFVGLVHSTGKHISILFPLWSFKRIRHCMYFCQSRKYPYWLRPQMLYTSTQMPKKIFLINS